MQKIEIATFDRLGLYKHKHVFPEERNLRECVIIKKTGKFDDLGLCRAPPIIKGNLLRRKRDYNYSHDLDRRFQIPRFKRYYPLLVPRCGSFFLYMAWRVQWRFDIVSKGERETERRRVVARYESKVAEYRATILKIKPHAISDSPWHGAQITFPSKRYKTSETCDSNVRDEFTNFILPVSPSMFAGSLSAQS